MDTVYCIITIIGTAAVLLGTKIWLAKLKRERPILPLLAECLALLGHTAVEQRESRFDDFLECAVSPGVRFKSEVGQDHFGPPKRAKASKSR